MARRGDERDVLGASLLFNAAYEQSDLSLPFGERNCMLCIVLGHDGSALRDFTTGSAGAREAVVAEWCAHGENRTDRRTIAVRSRACRFGLRFGGLLGHDPCCLDPCPPLLAANPHVAAQLLGRANAADQAGLLI